MLSRFRNIRFGSSIFIPDVSEFNNIYNIDAVRRAGYHALMMRVAVRLLGGGIREDFEFAQGRLKYVVSRNIVPIFYAYLIPGIGAGPEADAEFVYQAIERHGGFRRWGALPLVADIEKSYDGWIATREYQSRFDLHINKLTGRGCISYDPNWFWGNRGAPRGGRIYWASDYRTPSRRAAPIIPAGFRRDLYFWQFTDRASIPGISGAVDLSLFRGSQKQFESLRMG